MIIISRDNIIMEIFGNPSKILLLMLSLSLVSCHGNHLLSPNGGPLKNVTAVFDVTHFGANASLQIDSTQGFVQAWKAACRFSGKARVLVPPGSYYMGMTVFEGPCRSPSPLVFQLKGTLQPVSKVAKSTGGGKGWISFDSINGLFLTGGGTIDAQGQTVWRFNNCTNHSGCHSLADSLHFNNMVNTKVKGINLINSMGFHLHITNSTGFKALDLQINAPPDSPNTDGIHISKSRTVRISGNVISTGDDCVSMGPGSSDIAITNVTCGPGHGISVGSLGKLDNELDVIGVRVKNCTLVGTRNGVRIKTRPGSPGPSTASGLVFSNIIMDNVQNPIIIDQNYGIKSRKNNVAPSLVKISDVTYKNIVGTTPSQVAVSLMCSKRTPCENIRLANINLRSVRDVSRRLAPNSTCANAQVHYAGFQIPPPCSI